MTTSQEDAALVRSVVELGHNLGLDVVAEGIEDPLTNSALAKLRCDIGQRYHFASRSRPPTSMRWLDGGHVRSVDEVEDLGPAAVEW